MKRDEMVRVVGDELAHIAKGDREQMIFRATYEMQRESDLKRDALTPRGQSMTEAIRIAKKDSPSFEPAFDKAYFSQ